MFQNLGEVMKQLIKFEKDGSFEPIDITWDEIDEWETEGTSKAINDMIYKLAAYEKTGFNPEDVVTLFKLYKSFR